MNRVSIICPRYTIDEVKQILGKSQKTYDLINIRGSNGAGKSTIPLSMLDDPELSLITWEKDGKIKPFATWFRQKGYIALGTYMNKTGGLDTYKGNEDTKRALDLLIELPQNLLMEGVISSTIYSTYSQLFQDIDSMNSSRSLTRIPIIISLLPPVEVCLDRIQKRNGGQAIDEKAVISKWNTVQRNAEKFRDDGIISVEVDNSEWEKSETLKEFFEIIDIIHETIEEGE